MPPVEEKAEREETIFRAFLNTQPWDFRYGKWTHLGDGDQPDFINQERLLGVELTEWLDEPQTRRAIQIERFIAEIRLAVKAHRLTQFYKTFKPGDEGVRYSVNLHISNLPSQRDKKAVIEELLEFFLDTLEKRRVDLAPHGSFFVVPPDMPPRLACYFHGMIFFQFEGGVNLGVMSSEGGSYDPAQPLESLFRTIRRKVVEGSDLYNSARKKYGLRGLLLVVYYDRAILYHTPFEELGLQLGYGPDGNAGLKAVASIAHDFVHGLGGGGPFDRIFLMFAPDPNLPVFPIWP